MAAKTLSQAALPLVRETIVSAAYDLRGKGPQEYGIGGCNLLFLVKGPLGAVQCMIMTDWYPASARNDGAPSIRYMRNKPWITDIGYHAREAQYEDHKPMPNCPHLDGAPCYYDGTSLNEAWEEGLVNGGTAWLWPRLEELYRYRFEDGEYPDLSYTPVPYPFQKDSNP